MPLIWPKTRGLVMSVINFDLTWLCAAVGTVSGWAAGRGRGWRGGELGIQSPTASGADQEPIFGVIVQRIGPDMDDAKKIRWKCQYHSCNGSLTCWRSRFLSTSFAVSCSSDPQSPRWPRGRRWWRHPSLDQGLVAPTTWASFSRWWCQWSLMIKRQNSFNGNSLSWHCFDCVHCLITPLFDKMQS